MAFQRPRHRVRIEAPTTAQSASGAVPPGWTLVADDVPASIDPLSGREFLAANQVHAEVTTRITLGIWPPVDATMRVLHLDKIYNIRQVLPDPSFREHVTLLCTSGVNRG